MADTFRIDRVGHRGDGVAPSASGPAFIPYTLPGETVAAQPASGGRYRLYAVTQPSAERIAPFCPYFGRCGGCAIQHWQPDAYRAWKRNVVVETLAQAGLACDVGDLVDAHGAGRRRVTLHARRDTSGNVQVGFAAAGSHDIVAIDTCPILDPALSGALDAARALAAVLTPMGKPLDIQITAAREGLDVDVRGSGPVPSALIAQLAHVARTHRLARLTRHGELVLMQTPPTVAIGGAQVVLPPGAFLQATQAGEDSLGALVLQHCEGAKTVVDLFCGIGPFALRLATKARVAAYDSEAAAIAALTAAAKAPGLKPVKAEARDLFRRPLVPQELRDIDAVVFDPPRQGAEAQARQLAKSRVPALVAVSCNAATFARDLRILVDGGYRIDRVTPVDQFRHAAHVELVARLTR